MNRELGQEGQLPLLLGPPLDRRGLLALFYPNSSQVKLILYPKQRAKPAASRTRTCTNAAVCIASGECPSRF